MDLFNQEYRERELVRKNYAMSHHDTKIEHVEDVYVS